MEGDRQRSLTAARQINPDVALVPGTVELTSRIPSHRCPRGREGPHLGGVVHHREPSRGEFHGAGGKAGILALIPL
jgi:hypothetical protein